jgi:hypothetical protein
MFSFGLICHEVLTGLFPEDQAIGKSLPESAQLAVVLLRLLDKDPARRPTAQALLDLPFFAAALSAAPQQASRALASASVSEDKLDVALAAMRRLRQRTADDSKAVQRKLDIRWNEEGEPDISADWALQTLSALSSAELLQPFSFTAPVPATGKDAPSRLLDSTLPQLFYSSAIAAVLANGKLFEASRVSSSLVLPSAQCSDLTAMTRVGLLFGKALLDGFRVSAPQRLASAMFSFLAAPASVTSGAVRRQLTLPDVPRPASAPPARTPRASAEPVDVTLYVAFDLGLSAVKLAADNPVSSQSLSRSLQVFRLRSPLPGELSLTRDGTVVAHIPFSDPVVLWGSLRPRHFESVVRDFMYHHSATRIAPAVAAVRLSSHRLPKARQDFVR